MAESRELIALEHLPAAAVPSSPGCFCKASTWAVAQKVAHLGNLLIFENVASVW